MTIPDAGHELFIAPWDSPLMVICTPAAAINALGSITLGRSFTKYLEDEEFDIMLYPGEAMHIPYGMYIVYMLEPHRGKGAKLKPIDNAAYASRFIGIKGQADGHTEGAQQAITVNNDAAFAKKKRGKRIREDFSSYMQAVLS